VLDGCEIEVYLELWRNIGKDKFDEKWLENFLKLHLGKEDIVNARKIVEGFIKNRCAYTSDGINYEIIEPSKYFGIMSILSRDRADIFLKRFGDVVNMMYSVVLYGSVARGDETYNSDVEYLLILARKIDLSERTDSEIEIINLFYDDIYNEKIPGNILLLISSAIREGRVAFGHEIVERLRRDGVPREKILLHLEECAISLKETLSLLDVQDALLKKGMPIDEIVLESCAFTAFCKFRNIFSVECYWYKKIQYKKEMFEKLESIFPDKDIVDDIFQAYKARKVKRKYKMRANIEDIRRFIAALLRYLTEISEKIR